MRVEANMAAIETDGATAADRWQRVLERDSTDVEAINGLSYVTLAYGWQFGATLDDMIQRAERAIQVDSTDASVLFRRTQLSFSTFNPDDARRQLARLRALGSNAPLVHAAERSVQALLATNVEFASMADSLADSPPFEWVALHRTLRSVRPDRALDICMRTLRRAAPGPALDLARSGLVGLLIAAGRFSAVDSLWSAGGFGAEGIPWRFAQVIVHTALLGVEDSALTQRALRTLAAYVSPDSALAYFNTRPVWALSSTLGAWHAERGDTLMARRWLALLPQFPSGGSPEKWREAVAADIEGRLATRRGDADGARASIEQAYRQWSVHTGNASAADLEPAFRFRLAESLLARGLADSAARIFQSFVPPSSWIGSYVPLAHQRIAEVAERAGNRSVAARHFEQALQLWMLGDPGVSARRSGAEAGLRRTSNGAIFRYGGQ
jgi:hypothetical protein